MRRANGSTEEYFGLETEATSEFQVNNVPSSAASFRRNLPNRSCQVRPLIRARSLTVTDLSTGDSS